MKTTAVENTVRGFLDALNEEDFSEARNFLSDDVRFTGVMGSRDGGDAYIADMRKMKFKYDVKQIFENGNDVAVFYNIDMGGKVIFCAGWYVLEAGKIKTITVLFDPRPLL